MRPVVLVMFALCACAPSKAKRCERFAGEGLETFMAIANGVGDGLAGRDLPDVAVPEDALAKAKEAAISECMKWPDDFVACMTDGDFDSPECQEAYARKEGIVVPNAGRPGPAPEIRAVGKEVGLVCRGVGCVLDDGLEVRSLTGEPIPTKGELVGVFAAEGSDWTMFAADGDVTLVGPTTVTIKAPRAGPDDGFLTPLSVDPSGLALFDDGSMWRATAPFTADAESCWTKLPQVVPENLSTLESHEVIELAHGKLYRGAGSHLVTFAEDSRPRFHLHAKDDLGLPAVCGDTVFVSAAKAAYALDTVRCRSDGPMSPDQIGGNCVKAHFELPETAWARPARIDHMVFFLAEGRIYQMVDLNKGWVAEVEGDALAVVRRGPASLLLAASHWTADHPARLVSIDPASGRVVMQVDLDGSKLSIFDVELAVTNERVAVLTSGNLYSWSTGTLFASGAP